MARLLSLPTSSQRVVTPHSVTDKQRQRLEALRLHLNEPEPVLICRPCGYALKPFGERVSRHLAEKHDMPKQQRRGLSALVKSLRLGDPNDVARRPDGLPPHEALTVTRGHACRHCSYRTTSDDLVCRHLSKAHGIKDSRKADGWQRDHIHDGILLQSWSQNGARGYWIAQSTTPGSTPLRETGWMRRTGWDLMFDGARRDLLVKITPEDEAWLKRITSAVDGVFDRCEDTIRSTDVSMRCWLRSSEPYRPYKAPFELVGRQAIACKYRRLVKRLLCFCLRLWRLPLGARLSILPRQLD
ncbi:hypothetical protein LZ32DRAFT_545546 [Colletotrichum eremochloae]|nr:hypothetical protein LZ32DRAFT_545546 [Colletotrichum eremochloae]